MSRMPKTYLLGGGLDLSRSSLKKHPGSLLSCTNYEPDNEGGYRRIGGYERFDGLPSPTDAQYHMLPFDAGTTEPSVTDEILGGTSGATGEILAVEITSGTFAGNDAAGYLVITRLSGTFVDDENIRNSGDTATLAVVNGTTETNGCTNDDNHIVYIKASREVYRALISAVPGSGDIRGVWMFEGNVYAFRDNSGGTACIMYKSSSIGWVAQTLGGSLEFSAGTTAEPALGAIVTGGTSGATGVFIDTVYTGDWSANSATGRIWLKTLTGTFTDTETLTWTGGSATATSTTVDTFPPGGKYEFVNYNFKGQESSGKMYGCNGVGNAFQWDGSGLSMIYSGMTTDTPAHIYAHRRHLFLSYDSSVQHSAIGDPMDWDSLSGSGEIATGDTVTGFLNIPGEALAVFDRNSTYILYGSAASGSDAWNLTTHSFESGAVEWTCQNMGRTPKYLDDRGITALTTTQEYGDFKASTLSTLVEELLQAKLTLLNTSIRSREKNQYRLFFSDNTGLIMRDMGRRQGESFTTFEYPVEVVVTASVEDTNGTERLFFGSDDGFIYEMDKGDSFDGAEISYSLRTTFNSLDLPNHKKRFFGAVLEIDNTDMPDLKIIPSFSYGHGDTPGSNQEDVTNLTNGGGSWDGQDHWGDFYWDSPFTGEAKSLFKGSGVNISFLVRGSSNYGAPHRLHGMSVFWELRRMRL